VPELLKPAEFAAIKGVSKPTVHEAMKARIAAAIVEVNGRRLLNRDLALELWDANTRRNNNTKTGLPADRKTAERKTRQLNPDPPPPASLPTNKQLLALVQGLPEDQVPDLIDSQRRKEHYLAERAKVAALREREEVVTADQVKAEAFAQARAVRDALLGLADRLAPMLAATTDARECHRLLTEEHRVALRGLANG
jgi:hypothetical protein